eukprot:TRINITY_DN17760_c0_g4_i1.p1 TRINITY_DN17760_c0_g4~~TRINITY_DN17760_c0_g4_i1.p1  ORF type:complete len:1279 (-),score=349.65 TRINITY_DN17760_c0_g4_i1:99-3935(-)
MGWLPESGGGGPAAAAGGGKGLQKPGSVGNLLRRAGEDDRAPEKAKDGSTRRLGGGLYASDPAPVSLSRGRPGRPESAPMNRNLGARARAGWLPSSLWSSEVTELAEVMREVFAAYDGNNDGVIDCNEYVNAQVMLSEAAGHSNDGTVAEELFRNMNGARVRGNIGFAEFFQLQVQRLIGAGEEEANWPKLLRWCEHQLTVGRQREKLKETDEEIARKAAELRQLRAKRPRNSLQEKSISDQLKELWRQRVSQTAGKLILQGTVVHKGAPLEGAMVFLVDAESEETLACVKTNGRGFFEHRIDARLGRPLILKVRKECFAEALRRVGGDGVRNLRVELLPLSVSGRFRAEAGSKAKASFSDKKSGARFDVPVGDLQKDGRAFTGPVQFAASVVDVNSRDGVDAMPPMAGRTVAGGRVGMQSLGAVYTELRDASDNQQVQLRPGCYGIEVSLPSRAPLPLRQPSLWHYDSKLGAWEQSTRPLAVNGDELKPPDPDAEAPKPAVELGLGERLQRQQGEQERLLQAGRHALREQLEAAGEVKVCTCGYQAKQAIMPLVHDEFEMRLSDPPKRIFAAIQLDGHGGAQPSMPWRTPEDCKRSAEVASKHVEVVLSQRLAEVAAVFGSPKDPDTIRKHRESKFFKRDARKCIDALRHVVEWMVENTYAVETTSGEKTEDVDLIAMKLSVIERLCAYWAQTSSQTAPGATLLEMREALMDHCGDVVEAFLHVGFAQARRDEVAKVRQRLLARDPRMTAKYREVEQALEESDGSVELAADRLMRDPAIMAMAEKLKVREALSEKLPMAYPSTREVDAAMEKAKQVKSELTHLLTEYRQQLAEAQQKVEEVRAQYEEAAASKDKAVKEQAAELKQTLDSCEEEAQAIAEKLAEEEAKLSRADDPSFTAELLAEEPAVQEKAAEGRREWTDTLREGSKVQQLGFEVAETGWENVDSPLDVDPAEFPPPPAPVAVEVDYEFFPRQPPVVCPGQVSSCVLGVFDDGVFAKRATACGVRYRGIDYSETVQPDGTFSLVALAHMQFDLKTQKSDGTDGCSFGPFWAERAGKVSFLGLLDPHSATQTASMRSTFSDMKVSGVDIVLPALEFPPCSVAARGAREGTKHWLEGAWKVDCLAENRDLAEGEEYNHGDCLLMNVGASFEVTCLDAEEESSRSEVPMISLTYREGSWGGSGFFLKPTEGADEYPDLDGTRIEAYDDHNLEGDCIQLTFHRLAGDRGRVTVIQAFEGEAGEASRRKVEIVRKEKGNGERCTCFGDEDDECLEEEYDHEY